MCIKLKHKTNWTEKKQEKKWLSQCKSSINLVKQATKFKARHLCFEKRWISAKGPGQDVVIDLIAKISTEYTEVICHKENKVNASKNKTLHFTYILHVAVLNGVKMNKHSCSHTPVSHSNRLASSQLVPAAVRMHFFTFSTLTFFLSSVTFSAGCQAHKEQLMSGQSVCNILTI